ncbi:MAG: hypothetical protein R6V03_02130 [Kiritimatiellia bacterium]
MRFAYYRDLSPGKKRIYRASDAIDRIPLRQGGEIAPLTVKLHRALEKNKKGAVAKLASGICKRICRELGIISPIVKIRASRPSSSAEELHGVYEHTEGEKPVITVWMKTAAKRQVVAFKSFTRTVLHELCHHIDYAYFKLSDSFHTEGFFKRESRLYREIVPEKLRRKKAARKPSRKKAKKTKAVPRQMEMFTLLTLILLPVVACPGAEGESPEEQVWGRFSPVEVDDKEVITARHRFRIGPSGLPAQIFIKPDKRELPASCRKDPEKATDEMLIARGRGPQLRKQIELIARLNGKGIVLSPEEEAGLVDLKPAEAIYESVLAGGTLRVRSRARYTCDGALVLELRASAVKRTRLEELSLVMEPQGAVDTVYTGLPADFDAARYEHGALDLRPRKGTGEIWNSSDARASSPHGILRYAGFMFVGSGDRGFTFYGPAVGKDGTPVALTRGETGRLTWRMPLLGGPGVIDAGEEQELQTAVIQVHPAVFRAPGFRREQWLSWGSCSFTNAPVFGRMNLLSLREARIEAAEGKAELPVLPSPLGVTLEAFGRGLVLGGTAGAHVPSRDRDLTDLYPLSLFRYFCGTHTGLPAWVRPNVRDILTPGDDPSPGRQVLGRALLNDIGVHPAGLAQPVDFLRVTRIMEAFGAYSGDGWTEVIPYWRSDALARYGEKFSEDDGFELTREDPCKRVHITIYRRPEDPGRLARGYKAVLVVMNETETPVRERVFLPDPGKLLRGGNRTTGMDILKRMDFSKAGAVRDGKAWHPRAFASFHGYYRNPALKDLEDSGIIPQASTKLRDEDIYGPVFIRSGDFRLLYVSSLRRDCGPEAGMK